VKREKISRFTFHQLALLANRHVTQPFSGANRNVSAKIAVHTSTMAAPDATLK